MENKHNLTIYMNVTKLCLKAASTTGIPLHILQLHLHAFKSVTWLTYHPSLWNETFSSMNLMYFMLPKSVCVLWVEGLMTVWLRSPGMWQCTVWSSSPIRIFFMATLTLEDSGTMLLQYVENHLPNGTASHIQEDLNPVCILFTTNFNPLYIFLWLFYTFIMAFCKFLTRCGRVTQICVFNTVKLSTSASSP